MRNPALDFIRSLYPKTDEQVTANHGWVGLLNHDLEAPDQPGMARSLAGGWFRNPANETSVHAVVDRGEVIQTYDFGDHVWGCGTGNDYVIVQTEHVGYASWSKAQWRTPTMQQVIRNSARHQAWCWFHLAMKLQGIDYYPEWLSLTQIASRSRSGLLTHNDARLVWGGTTHTDPGQNFPYAELRDAIHAELDRLTGKTTPDVRGSYTVVKGDTLSGIGQRTGVPWKTIASLNGIAAPYVIVPGQVLKLTAGVTAGGGSGVPVPNKPKPKRYTPPPGAWPLAPGNYFGLVSGPAESHGGYYQSERKYIRWIKVRLRELGYKVPAGGLFRGGMKRAVAAWQHDRHASTTSRPGEVWADDWQHLINDR